MIFSHVPSALSLHVLGHCIADNYPFCLKENAVEDMLNGLVYTATHSHQNGAKVKAFVSRLLSGHASRDTVRLVLEKAFGNSLRTVKDSVEEYASPNVRGRHDEIEALQRQNLHAAVVNGRHLLWIVERMIELRVADLAVMEWSQQGAFTANLKRAFGDDTCSNIAPGLPAIVLRSTCGLASAVAAGSVVASRQVGIDKISLLLCVWGVCYPISARMFTFFYSPKIDHQCHTCVQLDFHCTVMVSNNIFTLQTGY